MKSRYLDIWLTLKSCTGQSAFNLCSFLHLESLIIKKKRSDYYFHLSNDKKINALIGY